MLNNWEDFNKICRNLYEGNEYAPPPAMFRSIQKKLFWTNCRLFFKAYSLQISLITICLITIPLFIYLATGNTDKNQFIESNINNISKQKEVVGNKIAISPERDVVNPEYIPSIITNYNVSVNESKPISNHKFILQQGNNNIEEKLVPEQVNNKSPLKKQDVNIENMVRANLIKLINTEYNQPANKENKFITPVAFIFSRRFEIIPTDERHGFSGQLSPVNDEYYSRNKFLDYNLKIYGGTSLAMGTRNEAPEFNNSESTAMKMTSDFTFSGTTGIAFDMSLKRLHFFIGAQYTQLQINYSANNLLYNSRIDTQTIITGYNPHIDEFNYIHYTYRLDSVIHTIDSVYTTEYDTTYQPVYELTRRQHYDTLKQAKWKETFHIIEVPVMIGYSLNLKTIDFSINGGLILGYITGTKYNTYAGYESDAAYIPVKTYYSYKSLQLSWIVSLSCTYWMGRHTGLEISPYYRRSILKIYSTDKRTAVNYNLFGANIGIIYKF